MTAFSTTAGTGSTIEDYDLSSLSVLVAEDSQATRELITTTLKDIGVGTVRKVANGLQAIEYLKSAKGGIGGNPAVDILITDLEMEPVDGVTLTRWVRRHMRSPNHFMRVMIISGSLNISRINMGRHAGVNDFIAKPFTRNSLRDRIYSVIHNNRPFVLVSDYFGPDRRRHEVRPAGEDKRTRPDPLRGEQKTASPTDEGDNIRTFDTPNYLEAIATGTEEVNLNYSKLKTAEAQSASWRQDFGDWALPHIALMKRELAAAVAAAGTDRVRHLEGVRRHVREIEGVATFLDYPLLSAVGRSVLSTLDMTTMDFDRQAILLERYIAALNVIARDHMSGEGGEAGQALVANLESLSRSPA